MNKYFTFLFFALLTACMAFAGPNDSKISITYLGSKSVRVEIDGKSYGSNDRLITIRNLTPGYHTIRIVYDDGKSNGYGRDERNLRTAGQALYNNKVRIRPNYHVDIVVNRFGKVYVDERIMDSHYDKDFDNDDWYYRDRNRNNDRRDDDGYDRRDDDRRDDRRDDRNHYRAMSETTFSQLVETLRKESFENTRLKLAKQTVETSYFTTSQVKRLVQLFAFENNKLDMAKFMYRLTIDRENYFQLYDVFDFSSSKEDLANYIRTVK